MDLDGRTPGDRALRGPDQLTQERFPLIVTTRRVLPLALSFALGGAWVIPSLVARIACGVFAAFVVAVWVYQSRARPMLVLDADGYAVEEHGREKLRVGWREVVKVRADDSEQALYVDCGDPSRNLLVPPARGYGFRFERTDEIFARVLAAVPDRIEHVEKLTQ